MGEIWLRRVSRTHDGAKPEIIQSSHGRSNMIADICGKVAEIEQADSILDGVGISDSNGEQMKSLLKTGIADRDLACMHVHAECNYGLKLRQAIRLRQGRGMTTR